jgi:hypothetical protein
MAITRHYYIAAEDVSWDYAPSGRDLLHARDIPQPWAKQTRWTKTQYIEYTDSTFSVRKPQPEWLGILGPIIRAEVGDTIIVEFLNRSHMRHSIHPHGLRYTKSNEGAAYVSAITGFQVPPGTRYTYRWLANTTSGPGPGDPSSVVWWYHAHSEEPMESNAGLMGPIVVTAKGKAKPDGSPKDVDREFIAMFMIFDELKGKDAGLFHTINGYVFGNLPGLLMKKGDRVRWYLLGMGNEKDLHTPHWHGQTVLYREHHTDVVELLPATMLAVDMVADNPGTWLFHCQVADHMESGMMASYTIYEPQTRSCPIKFVSGDFWNKQGKFTLGLKNESSKTIRSLTLMSGHFFSRQDLRPFIGDWFLKKPLPPTQEETLEMNNYLYNSQALMGWAFFPFRVQYQDGSEWKPQQPGECFQVYWRDKEHPKLPVLPPFQNELHED